MYNSSDGNALDQICDETTLSCEDGDCCGTACSGDVATYAGTGDGTISPSEGDPGVERPTTSVALPVSLLSFIGAIQNGNVQLTCQTASELDNDYFLIERSLDGVTFEIIAKVAGQGTTTQLRSYSYEDFRTPMGSSFYRMKQVDFDGTTTIYHAIRMELGVISSSKVYPNTAKDHINMQWGSDLRKGDVTMSIMKISGQLIERCLVAPNQNVDRIPLSLSTRLYFLRFENDITSEQFGIIIR